MIVQDFCGVGISENMFEVWLSMSMKLWNPNFVIENSNGNLNYFLLKMILYCSSVLSFVVSCDIDYICLYWIYLVINSEGLHTVKCWVSSHCLWQTPNHMNREQHVVGLKNKCKILKCLIQLAQTNYKRKLYNQNKVNVFLM